MAVYNRNFSEKLIVAANAVVDDGLEALDAKRAVLYLSLLACEITLKALLEKAGVPVKKIKNRAHKLSELLRDLGECEIEKEIRINIGSRVYNVKKWVPGSYIRSLTIDNRYANATVGTILEAENEGASNYPNQIRYGEKYAHYPSELVLKAAEMIVSWANKYWDSIRVP